MRESAELRVVTTIVSLIITNFRRSTACMTDGLVIFRLTVNIFMAIFKLHGRKKRQFQRQHTFLKQNV